MNVIYLLLFFSAFLCVCLCDNVVVTSSGVYKGVNTGGATKWLSMRFAKAPIGELRWRPPVPLKSDSNEIITADNYGASCIQGRDDQVQKVGFQSEDCLFINVFAPLNAKNVSVMVFIYGGGFISGTSSLPVYDGSSLAKEHNVIVVSFNYRLGPFGFAALDVFGQGQGNFGILDQIEAFRWVKANIAQFGGRSSNVTIFGQSAGAISICAHLVSPLSRNLYTNALMESGFCTANPLNMAQTVSAKMATDVGCTPTNATCLRNVSAKQLQEATKSITYRISVDHYLLDAQPIELLEMGKINPNVRVVILGSNSNETTKDQLRTPQQRHLSQNTLRLRLMRRYNAHEIVSQIEKLYVHHALPQFNVSAFAVAWEMILTDTIFGCPTIRAAKALANAGISTFHYIFAHIPTCTYEMVPKPYKLYRAFHTAELPYVFNTSPNTHCMVDSNGVEISHLMGAFWTSLATFDDPNLSNYTTPFWPRFGENKAKTLLFGKANAHVISHFRTQYCDFWDSLR